MSVSRDFIDSYSPEASRPQHRARRRPAPDDPASADCGATMLVFGFQPDSAGNGDGLPEVMPSSRAWRSAFIFRFPGDVRLSDFDWSWPGGSCFLTPCLP